MTLAMHAKAWQGSCQVPTYNFKNKNLWYSTSNFIKLLSFSKIGNAKRKINQNRKNHDVHKTYIFYTPMKHSFLFFFQSFLYKNDRGPSSNPLFTISYKVHISPTKISFPISNHSQMSITHLNEPTNFNDFILKINLKTINNLLLITVNY
jgi:hypothetical protein